MQESDYQSVSSMRREYNFSKGVRGRFSTRRPGPDREDEKLTASQARELQRRMADLRDQTRYLLVSKMGPRFALYYNVSDDVYAMNDPRGATLFKRRNAALAVKALLGPRIRVIRCGSKRLNGVQVPLRHSTPRRRTMTAGTSSSPNRRLQPPAGPHHRPPARRMASRPRLKR